METNESILTRQVVGLDDRKVLGKVNGLRVDCDTLAVSHYIVNSATTGAPLALPFEASLAVGDTFLTVQSRERFVPASAPEAQQAVRDGFSLVGVDVFSRAGDALDKVKSYEFDPVFGTVTSISLEDGRAFDAEAFVFFAPEFVFVDDGTKTAAELRGEGTRVADESLEEAESPVEDDADRAKESAPDGEITGEDAALIEFLTGVTVTEDVESRDGAFSVAAGTELTVELLKEAHAHGALLLLTLSVDA